MNIYRSRYNENDKDYNFLKVICCDFKKLEIECRGWTYDHLIIKLKEKYNLMEYIEINKNTKFSSLIELSDYGIYSRVENFDENSSELQRINIYAKDEFGQEKYVEAIVKVKEKDVDQTMTYVLATTTVLFALSTIGVLVYLQIFKKKSISAIKAYYERRNKRL